MQRSLLLFILPILSLLSGCSVYESDGRKFLERQGLEFAGVAAQANQTGCGYEPTTTAWVRLERNAQADIFASEGETFQLRVRPRVELAFSCYFTFNSAQEMYAKTSSAVDLTLLNQSLGEFAFHHLTHLK